MVIKSTRSDRPDRICDRFVPEVKKIMDKKLIFTPGKTQNFSIGFFSLGIIKSKLIKISKQKMVKKEHHIGYKN